MKKSVVLFLLFTAFFISCKKNELGGKSEISGKVVHHSKGIANSTVYIKFNATEFPGDDVSQYDDKVQTDSQGNYSFKCFKGNYYLYGLGIDYDAQKDSNLIVKGGVPVKIRHKEKVEALIAVTEIHI